MPIDPGYPVLGFHFRVSFVSDLLLGPVLFQSAEGLSVKLKTDSFQEGGENRFAHSLPTGTEYSPLKLKRGSLKKDSFLYWWCYASILSNFTVPIAKQAVQLELLSQGTTSTEIIRKWVFFGAWPVSWQVEGFDASKNDVVIETLELRYDYYRQLPF
jgi:phage tail-like protein